MDKGLGNLPVNFQLRFPTLEFHHSVICYIIPVYERFKRETSSLKHQNRFLVKACHCAYFLLKLQAFSLYFI